VADKVPVFETVKSLVADAFCLLMVPKAHEVGLTVMVVVVTAGLTVSVICADVTPDPLFGVAVNVPE
jgi:hypothetical protein